jgi:hypothetical protein
MPKFMTWTGRKYSAPDLQRAYRQMPYEVLQDIGDFCHAYDVNGTFDPDPYIHARNEGRRQVFQRILNHIHLNDQQMMALMLNQPVNYEED